jgi:hypothetical protein
VLSPDRYYDHHMLFHLLLAPFVASDVMRGAKWASALFGGLAFLAVYFELIRHGVRHPGWWLLAMFALAPDFLTRMEMPRVQALSLVCLLLAIEVLLARRFVWLLPLAVLYTWLYDAFPLLLLVAGLVAVAIVAFERHLEWRTLSYPATGIGAALILNPYFPKDLWFIAHHYLGKVQIGAAIHVGTEWYPYPAARWLGWGGAIAVLATAAVVVWRERRRLDVTQLALLLIAALFFVLTWRSRRFIEYAAPLILLALARALHGWLDHLLEQVHPMTHRVLAALVVAGCIASTVFAVGQLRRKPPPGRYAAGAEWLVHHTDADAMVLTPDWDDFPLLFFHDQRNRYVIGLDPTYLALRKPDLYRIWQALGRGELAPPSHFLYRFDSKVVLSSRSHTSFIAALEADRGMERVYEDADCVIFRLRP